MNEWICDDRESPEEWLQRMKKSSGISEEEFLEKMKTPQNEPPKTA